MSPKKYWLAFGIGVVAGAAVALLYAPQTGTRTRRQLRNQIGDAGDYLEDAGNYLKAQAERLSQEAQAAINRSKSYVEDVVESASDLAETAVKHAKSLV